MASAKGNRSIPAILLEMRDALQNGTINQFIANPPKLKRTSEQFERIRQRWYDRQQDRVPPSYELKEWHDQERADAERKGE